MKVKESISLTFIFQLSTFLSCCVERITFGYLFESKFVFKPGVEHLVNLVITDNPDKIKIEIGGEVENWK